MTKNPYGIDGIVDGVDIEWADARGANLANWEDRVPLHLEAYNLTALREDPRHLSQVVTDDLPVLTSHLASGSLEGMELCHLQCHIGTDTLSLARAGARVTGVDFSPAALIAARTLAAEIGIEARFVEGDVLESRALVDAQLGPDVNFDVVYTSIGTISWLRDLDRWGAQIATLLKPGGLFYFRDAHPFLFTLDDEAPDFTVKYRYFGDGRALAWDDDSTYVGDGTLEHTTTFEWPHPVSEIVSVLLRHGLQLVALDEGTTLPWKFMERMEELPDGNYVFPAHERDKMPCTITVVARKPL